MPQLIQRRCRMRFLRRSAFVCLFVLRATFAMAHATAVVRHDVNLRPTPSAARTPIRLLTPDEALTLITRTTVTGYYHVLTAQNQDDRVYRTSIMLGST